MTNEKQEFFLQLIQIHGLEKIRRLFVNFDQIKILLPWELSTEKVIVPIGVNYEPLPCRLNLLGEELVSVFNDNDQFYVPINGTLRSQIQFFSSLQEAQEHADQKLREQGYYLL